MPKPAYTIKPCKHPKYKFVVRSIEGINQRIKEKVQ
jgi:hypothetical protein